MSEEIGFYLKGCREKLKTHRTKADVRGSAAIGTQEWLADRCGVRVRTISNLEKGRSVSSETIKAVCAELGVNYNRISQTTRPTISPSVGNIDFRSQKHLNEINGNLEELKNTRLMITLSPFEIVCFDDDYARLQGISLTYPGEDNPFSAFRTVKLVDGGTNWLGYEDDFGPNYDISSEEPFNKSVMFTQKGMGFLTWGNFLSALENSESTYLDFQVDLEFNDYEYRNNEFFVKFLMKLNTYELKHNLKIFMESKDTLPQRMHGEILIMRETIKISNLG